MCSPIFRHSPRIQLTCSVIAAVRLRQTRTKMSLSHKLWPHDQLGSSEAGRQACGSGSECVGMSGASGTRHRKGRGAPLCTAGVASWNVVSFPHAVTRGEEFLSRWCLTLRGDCLCLHRGCAILMLGGRGGGAVLPSPRHRPAALARQPRSAGSAPGLRWAHRGRQSCAPPQTGRAARSPRS